MRLLPPNRKS